MGWRWKNTGKYEKHSCDLVWLDAMPSGENDVSEFNEAVQKLEVDLKGNLYKGKYEPLSEDAYNVQRPMPNAEKKKQNASRRTIDSTKG